MRSLLGLTWDAGSTGRLLSDQHGRVGLDTLIGGGEAAYRGASVVITAPAQRAATLAMLSLDGIARRIVLCPPGLSPDDMQAITATAEADHVLTEMEDCALLPGASPARQIETEWVLLTSGTTGRPKLIVHTLASLLGPLADGIGLVPDTVWSTFYDVRRYGGLQILLRALVGGASMVFSSPAESVDDFLARVAAAGVTHISGTPSHWRKALMSPENARITPDYVRLSGEIADQAILDRLHAAFPNAGVAHAFASTEAGVAFDVRDGRAGFPAALIGQTGGPAEMRVEEGTLRIRSARIATHILGEAPRPIADADGFVDTGDRVEREGDRYLFIGRREGVINVGGLKVHPEEVEAVINRQPNVRMSRVWARRSPITGNVVAADVVLEEPAGDDALLRKALRAACIAALPAHKVPASIRVVPSLEVAASGKMVRLRA